MKLFIKSLYKYLLLLLALCFTSCIDDPVNPEGNMVSGSLYDQYGTKIKTLTDAFLISPGNQPITMLPYGSDFSINTFTSPFDIVITSFRTSVAVKYQDVEGSEIKPIFFDPTQLALLHYETFALRIRIPEVRKNQTKLYTKLLTNKFYIPEWEYHQLQEGDSILYHVFKLRESEYTNKVFGSLMIFEVENREDPANTNYKRFGIKAKDTINRYNNTIVFTEEELQYDIPETQVTFKNTPPAGRSSGGNKIAITFPGYEKHNDLELYNSMPDEHTLNIPLLPIENKIRYTGLYNGGMFYEEAFKTKIFEAGESGEIVHKEPITLVAPADGDSLLYGTSEFRINDNEPGGIYLYEFMQIISFYEYRILRFFTGRKELHLSDITCRGFERQPNTRYYWTVSKFPEYQNTGEFLSSIYFYDTRYNSTQMTERRMFFTGP